MLAFVTGGAGYLGGHLSAALIDAGWEVRIFDLRRTKYVPQKAELVEGDVRDRAAVRQAVRGASHVFHLAFVQSMSKLPEPVRAEIDLAGTRNVVDAASAEGVERFIHTSTIEIYGASPPVPCVEDAPTRPVGWYGRHKLESERIVLEAVRAGRLPAAIVRMPTICGPGAYNHRPLLSLMDRILDGKPVAVTGDGSLKGDFVHVSDVVEGYLRAASASAAVGEAFNLSCPSPSSHLEIVSAMIRAVGSRSRVYRLPRWLARPAVSAAVLLGLTELPREQKDYVFFDNTYSIEKARRMIGYAPRRTASEAAAALIRGYASDRAFIRRRSESY